MSVIARGSIGIIGAGKSGTAIARLALAAGYSVNIAAAGSPSDTELMMKFVAPGVIVTTVHDVTTGADIVFLAVPLRRFREIPAEVLAEHVVVDVMNYWPPIDGVLPELDGTGRASSAIVQDALPSSTRLVKSFNHLGYHQMEDLARPTGDPGRIALGLAGNSPDAVQSVSAFVDAVGFDPVDAGPLAQSHHLQPETPLFGTALDRDSFAAALGRQPRKALT